MSVLMLLWTNIAADEMTLGKPMPSIRRIWAAAESGRSCWMTRTRNMLGRGQRMAFFQLGFYPGFPAVCTWTMLAHRDDLGSSATAHVSWFAAGYSSAAICLCGYQVKNAFRMIMLTAGTLLCPQSHELWSMTQKVLLAYDLTRSANSSAEMFF